MHWKLHLNILLYVSGSCLFIIGSVLFHPHFSAVSSLYQTGVLTFTIGSCLFAVASLQQLHNNFRSVYSSENILSDDNQSLNMDLAVSFCRNTIGSVSGFLFIVGSIAFWPSFGHGGALVGNWLYRCGASLSLLNSLWALIREQMKLSKYTLLKLMILLSLFGAIGFLVGGGYFLYGGKYDSEGSYSWLAGSISYLLSSLIIYKL